MDWHSDQQDEEFEALLRQFQPPTPPALQGSPMSAGWMAIAAGVAVASAVPIWWVWSGPTTTERAAPVMNKRPAGPQLGQSSQGRPLRVGVDIQAPPRKVYHVDPIYPDDAKAGEIDGAVILHIIIGDEGSVRDAQVVRSIPLLNQAAIDAVLQWQFMPTLLNGEAVEVEMDVVVSFILP